MKIVGFMAAGLLFAVAGAFLFATGAGLVGAIAVLLAIASFLAIPLARGGQAPPALAITGMAIFAIIGLVLLVFAPYSEDGYAFRTLRSAAEARILGAVVLVLCGGWALVYLSRRQRK